MTALCLIHVQDEADGYVGRRSAHLLIIEGLAVKPGRKVFGAPALEATTQRRWSNSVPGYPSKKKHKRQHQLQNIRKAAATDRCTGHSIKNNRFVYFP